ncbi:hypothetical protein CFI00_05000 [Nocardioides sp. S5]|uniref:hypothetical protein n=1 Tax=Nocardioides sp. S5 TaxID=2017486 RepID=UPI001A8E3D92|nr:hypothetical protein [Nocardioides sp. S5]QSR29875.1 hypothetical protein CFI00_05000 [Nocardioides sp. S5]
MNSYSLTADSRRWWWLPATAGALGTAAVTAILVVPATGSASLPAPPPTEVGGTGVVVERPCYLARPGWNTARGWDQPVCGTELRRRVLPAPRPAPDYLP